MLDPTAFGSDAVTVAASATHGRGLHAARPVPAGATVTVAHVLVLDADASDALADHPVAAYLVAWDGDRTAVPFGPVAFVNHDPDPNAELVVDHDAATVALVARRPVPAGAELTIDYGPDHPV